MPNAAPPSLSGALTTRIFEGKELLVGVAGSTLIELCGDLALDVAVDTAGEASEALEVDEALL